MFTGLVADIGKVESVEKTGDGARLRISTKLAAELGDGDSISVGGACLTAAALAGGAFEADAMNQTLELTTLGGLEPGDPVNLELALRAADRLGGHIVQGHVDGTGEFLALDQVRGADDYWLRIEIPPDLARYVIFKGSLCIEGISLTVAKVEGTKVTAAIIPHTVKMTNLKSLRPGDPVNLEVDLVAKYVEKMIKGESASSSLTVERLIGEGF
jgi:riboflavin synthase